MNKVSRIYDAQRPRLGVGSGLTLTGTPNPNTQPPAITNQMLAELTYSSTI